MPRTAFPMRGVFAVQSGGSRSRSAAHWLGPVLLLAVVAAFFPAPSRAIDGRPRHYNHVTSFGYMNSQEIPDEHQAQFVASHFDVWRGQGNYARDILEWNPNIVLAWGLNVRAIAEPEALEIFSAQNPQYDREEYFLHYRYDTRLETDYGPIDIPGYDPHCIQCPGSSARTWVESRVPDRTNPGWMVPNPRSRGLAHFYAESAHNRHDWYGEVGGIFWDWSAGFVLHLDNKLENTWEYEGQVSDSWFVHPSIDDFIGIIDSVSVQYRERYPDEPERLTIANGIAGFWMYDRPEGNDYRQAVLGSSGTRMIWMEMGMVFGERNQPSSQFLHTDLHLKYMKDLPVLMQHKPCAIQLRVRDTEPTDRDKLFALGYAYLFNEPERFAISYVVEGQDGNPNYGIETSHWLGPAIEHDIGLPIVNPPGVVDINGNAGTSVFYQWASGDDPGNEWRRYTIFAREYENALVLVKVRQGAEGVWDETTATEHALGRFYSPLRADGTLGEPGPGVVLRNNEAAILIRANTPPSLTLPRVRTVYEGEELRVLARAHDVDQNDALVLSSPVVPPGAEFEDNGDRTGTIIWTPDYDQAGVYPNVRVDVTDGEAMAFREMTINVIDSPPAAHPEPEGAPGEPGVFLSNPYRRGGPIVLRAAGASEASIAVYDVHGRKVRTLRAGGGAGAASGSVTEVVLAWDGSSDTGLRAGAGVYYLVATTGYGRMQTEVVLAGD